MDDSQSSEDVFSDHGTNVLSSSCKCSLTIMDVLAYESFLHKTKASLCNNVEIQNVSFPNHFRTLLEDCRLCINQSLDFVVNILSNATSNILLSNLSQYMENAVSLLQLLSNLIKTVVESISLSCCIFKTFPTTTGHIIMLVFTHCKNSEAVYGVQFKNVEMQLKDLFKTCHELQLTYLMVLEKNFILDPTEKEQLDVIIEALEINLKIGQVAQSLDAKSMCDQWKAIIAICEKYSSHLMDKLIYQQNIETISCMTMSNLKIALEADNEKMKMRSFIITNFGIRIMVKMFMIFQHTPLRDYSQLIDLLIFVHLHDPSYLELEENPMQIINAMTTNVTIPIYSLLDELIWDMEFVNVVITYVVENVGKDEKCLGYTLLIVNVVKSAAEKSREIHNIPKTKLIDCVFRCISHCHVWMNVGLKFKSKCKTLNSFGLFEYILINTIALALSVNSEEMCHVERTMYEAILGAECVAAIFASSLWKALTKISNNRQLLVTQMISLCQIYQRLESHKLFSFSPQKHNLALILSTLFECMRQEDKIRLSRQFNPLDSKNMSLWIDLKINNLPSDVQRNIQEEILEKFKHHLTSNLDTKESVDDLVKIMKLAASCSCSGFEDDMTACLIEAWMKACPKNYTFLSKTIDKDTLWYFEYVGALVMFTCGAEQMFYQNSAHVIKVLHVICNIVQIGNSELNLLVIDLLCNLAIHPVNDDNHHSAATLVNESLRTILIHDCSNNDIVKNKLFRIINTCDNKCLEQIQSSVISKDPVLQELWNNFFQFRKGDFDEVKLKDQLMLTGELKYVHKCIECRLKTKHYPKTVDVIPNTRSSNFDLADLDTLFVNESDQEQPIKKIKLDGGAAQAILNRLENDTSLLCTLKENVLTSEHRNRIKDLCEKLKSLVN